MMAKRIAPVISLLLAFCILASGCSANDLLRPSVEDIVGANLYLSAEPIALAVDLQLMTETGTVLYYNSTVSAYQDTAIWDGIAKVYYGGMYFQQNCKTVCDGTGSRKFWREKWAVSDTISPAPVISKWLERAKQRGAYSTNTVVPAEQSGQLDSLNEPAYYFTWIETDVDWKALCDAHPDTMFGGEELMARFQEVELFMYIGTEDLRVQAIRLTAEGEDIGWISYTIMPAPAQDRPDVAYSGEIEENILLQEEWNIIDTNSTGDDATQE